MALPYVQGPQGEIRRSFRQLKNAGRHQGRCVRDVGGISGNDIATLQVLNGYYKLFRKMISLPWTAKRVEAEHKEQHIL